MPLLITLLLEFSNSAPQREFSALLRALLQMKKFITGLSWMCVFQALDALKSALQQEPADPMVKAELHFSMGNQLREMNQLDQAFQVTVRLREQLFKYSLSTHSCLLGCSLPTDSSQTIWCIKNATAFKSRLTGFYQSSEKHETWGLFFCLWNMQFILKITWKHIFYDDIIFFIKEEILCIKKRSLLGS